MSEQKLGFQPAIGLSVPQHKTDAIDIDDFTNDEKTDARAGGCHVKTPAAAGEIAEFLLRHARTVVRDRQTQAVFVALPAHANFGRRPFDRIFYQVSDNFSK